MVQLPEVSQRRDVHAKEGAQRNSIAVSISPFRQESRLSSNESVLTSEHHCSQILGTVPVSLIKALMWFVQVA